MKSAVLLIMADDLGGHGGAITRAVLKTPHCDRPLLWENTLVIFLGDHGYHLGERGWRNKDTLFDRACRALWLIAALGVKSGQVCRSPVEFLDLYPTVAHYCGLTAPHALAGQSLRPVLADPTRLHKDAAFTLVTRAPQRFGRTVTTARWRFTQWSDGDTELYDHDADPTASRNLSVNESNAQVIAEPRSKLAALPPWLPQVRQ